MMRDNAGPLPGYRRSYVNDDYVDAVVKNGGVPYIIPFNIEPDVISTQVAHIDALILSGGHDVDPRNYGEEARQKIGEVWPDRDRFDMGLLSAAEQAHIPVLGICRGAQLINVAHGGDLYQDLSYRKELTLKHMQGYTPAIATQTVKLRPGSYFARIFNTTELAVNSFHHQIIRHLGDGLVADARAKDGVIEAFENHDASVIGVQWHPEMLHRRLAIMNRLFADFIQRAQEGGQVK
jgi:putative glutamine amidotransferase